MRSAPSRPSTATRSVDERCRRILDEHSHSFSLAARLLPEPQRHEAAVLYAFCRRVDDAVDDAPDETTAAERLSRIRDELFGPTEPGAIVRTLLDVARRRDLDLAQVRELLKGVESDLGVVRVADDGELLRYCYRVAGTVGLLMAPVLGIDDERAFYHAVDLGVGMQITNICRDVAEDAERHRVYLPAERLRVAGTSQEEVLEGEASEEAVSRVVRDLLQMADDYYASADRGMRYIPARCRLGIVAAARIYRSYGVQLRQHGCNPLRVRPNLSLADKLRGFVNGAGAWFHPRISGYSPDCEHNADLHTPIADLPGTHAP